MPTQRVLDAANALITAPFLMGRSVSFVPRTLLSWPMSVRSPPSAESRHALKIYNAALDDLETPATDIAFLRSIYESHNNNETESQADFDRANPVAYAAYMGTAHDDFSDTD